MFKQAPYLEASQCLQVDTCRWINRINSLSPNYSIFAPMAKEDTTSIMTSSQWSTPLTPSDHLSLLLYFGYMNSKNQSSLSSQQRINQIDIQRTSSQSNSSEDDESSKYSVRITSRINQIKKQSSSLRYFEQQIQQLKKQNVQLREQNAKLVQFLSQARQESKLKRQVQSRDQQILQLRHQLATYSYGESNSSSCKRLQSAINVDIEDKRYKLRSKSKNTSNHKQSLASSVQDQTESVRLHVFDQLQQLKKVKTDKLILQKHFYELQEKILILQHQIKWMNNLASKLVSMAEKISYIFKQKLFEQRWELLKRAKVSWRYLKHILSYIFEIK